VHRHRALLLANLVGLATSALVAVLLVPDHGAKGAAIATLAGEGVLAVVYTLTLLGPDRRLRVSAWVVPKVAVATGAALALALVPGLDGLLLVLAATGVYFAVLALVRGIPSELYMAFLEGRSREPS